MKLHVGYTEIPPEENSNRVLNDIHELLIQLSHLTPPICFDVPNLNRVTHPVSGMLEETLGIRKITSQYGELGYIYYREVTHLL